MIVQHPLYWFALDGAHGKRWDFFLSTPQINPCLVSKKKKQCPHGLYGTAIYAESRVYVNALYPDSEVWSTTIHEMHHVALEPWSSSLAKKYGADAEEDFVKHSEPGLASFLAQIGVEMPALPFGIEQMRAQARRRKK